MKMYHGSPFAGINDDFSNFKTRGAGIFFTDSERAARQYAVNNTGLTMGERPPGALLQPTVYTVDVRPKNTFDLREHASLLPPVLRQRLEPDSSEVDERLGLPKFSLAWALRKALQPRFDSAWFSDDHGISLCVFLGQEKGKIKVISKSPEGLLKACAALHAARRFRL